LQSPLEGVRSPAGLDLDERLTRDREAVRVREPLGRLALRLEPQPGLALPAGRDPQEAAFARIAALAEKRRRNTG
jgi:hypothetical protein